ARCEWAWHEARAEPAPAHYERAFVILQRACDDLRRRRASFVNQHNEVAGFKTTARSSIGRLIIAAVISFGVYDPARSGKEFIRNIDGHIQVPSRIALQIKDQFLHALLFEFL